MPVDVSRARRSFSRLSDPPSRRRTFQSPGYLPLPRSHGRVEISPPLVEIAGDRHRPADYLDLRPRVNYAAKLIGRPDDIVFVTRRTRLYEREWNAGGGGFARRRCSFS